MGTRKQEDIFVAKKQHEIKYVTPFFRDGYGNFQFKLDKTQSLPTYYWRSDHVAYWVTVSITSYLEAEKYEKQLRELLSPRPKNWVGTLANLLESSGHAKMKADESDDKAE